MTALLNTALGQLQLHRYPHINQSLQAFDAADEYLLNTLASHPISGNPHILVLNDQFGALACSLARYGTVSSSGDSYLSLLALQHNLQTNQLESQQVSFIPSIHDFTEVYDIVLIRVPKTLALLEQQLINLQAHITKDTLIIAGAMVKHLSKGANTLFEKYIGTVQASLAVKKARLLHITVQPRKKAVSPYPNQYQLDNPKLQLINYANVFCRESLDIGTRAFIPHLPNTSNPCQVADLGCGNGVLAIIYALNNPNANLTLVDESYMAIASAKENWRRNLLTKEVNICIGDGLIGQHAGSLDLVLCNPPFHQQQIIGDFLAKRMFKQAHQSLKNTGELWLVFNRHLNYMNTLRNIFSNVLQIHQTPKFLIAKAIK